MVKSIVVKLAKKYIVSALNDTLAAKSEDVAVAKTFVQTWLARVKVIIAALEKALAYLEDNKLDDKEAEEIVNGLNVVEYTSGCVIKSLPTNGQWEVKRTYSATNTWLYGLGKTVESTCLEAKGKN